MESSRRAPASSPPASSPPASSPPASSPPASSSATTREEDPLPPDRQERLERLAFLLDDAVRIPGTQRRVGFDALIGLVPGVGDAAGAAVSSYILYEGARLGVSLATLLRMALNIGIEAVVGLVPLLGDLFDFAFKANKRNVRLINGYLDDPDATHRSSRTMLTTVAVVLVLLVLGLVVGCIWLIGSFLDFLAGAI